MFIENFMLDLNLCVHPREKFWGIVINSLGALIWLGFFFFSIKAGIPTFIGICLGALIAGIITLIYYWILENLFKAIIFGNAIHVNQQQHPEIYQILEEQAKKLNVNKIPDTFILNGQGAVNAAASRILHRKYIFLFAELVDLSLERNEWDELKMIIGHEMAHHKLGHTNPALGLLRFWISPVLFLILFYFATISPIMEKTMPAEASFPKFPEHLSTIFLLLFVFSIFLKTAWRRGCELSCDRVGFSLTQNLKSSELALLSITGGSRALSSKINAEAFKNQEKDIPLFFAFLYEIFSEYPRMTKRIIELGKFVKK